eukprot:1142768-Pelagomonas_calceolata.AAC.4
MKHHLNACTGCRFPKQDHPGTLDHSWQLALPPYLQAVRSGRHRGRNGTVGPGLMAETVIQRPRIWVVPGRRAPMKGYRVKLQPGVQVAKLPPKSRLPPHMTCCYDLACCNTPSAPSHSDHATLSQCRTPSPSSYSHLQPIGLVPHSKNIDRRWLPRFNCSNMPADR